MTEIVCSQVSQAVGWVAIFAVVVGFMALMWPERRPPDSHPPEPGVDH